MQILDVDPQHHETSLPQLGVESVQSRNLRAAGRTPAGPQMEHDYPAAIVVDRDGSALQIDQIEGGGQRGRVGSAHAHAVRLHVVQPDDPCHEGQTEQAAAPAFAPLVRLPRHRPISEPARPSTPQRKPSWSALHSARGSCKLGPRRREGPV